MQFSKVLLVLALAGFSLAKRAPNPALFTGLSCNVTEDCTGGQVFCNELQKCECTLGWQPETIANVITICNYNKCTADAQCEALYGPNAHCELQMCGCGPSTKYNPADRECQLEGNFSKLGGKCETMKDCGRGARCNHGECKCEIGHKKANDYGCEYVRCKSNHDCEDITPNSVCDLQGFCSCYSVSHMSENYTACKHNGPKLGEPCGPLIPCSADAACRSNVCQPRQHPGHH